MAIDDNIIVTIELGSSRITAIAGHKQPDGAINVLAHVQKKSDSFIRKGRINNINKTVQCIHDIKEHLEKKLQKSITRVYVGVGGMGLHSVHNSVTRHLGEKTQITEDIVRNLLDSNRTMPGNDREILEVIPQKYILGAQETDDAVGISSESIEGQFLNIVASASVNQDIRDCFSQKGIGIAGIPISHCALADTILSEPEKRSGCVFVDMGAETTSVAVYRNNLLRHLAIIPLGGASINRDLCSLQIEDEEAESLKRQYGSAYRENTEGHAPIVLQDGRTVSFEDFSGLVEARMEEIILNINNQIALSGYDKSQLIGGLIVAGGAACMKDTDKAFLKYTGFEKMRFVKNIRQQVRVEGKAQGNFNADGSYNTAIALIDKCELNCCGAELGTETVDIFGNNMAGNEIPVSKPSTGGVTGLQNNGEHTPSVSGEAGGQAVSDNSLTENEQEVVQKQKGPGAFTKMWRKFSEVARKVVADEEPIINEEEKKEKK